MAKEFPVKVRLSAVDKITAPMDRITNLFPKFDKAIKRSALAMRLFDKETEKLNKDLKAVGGKMQSIGTAMTVGITAPVLAGVALSIGAFREYETALIGVGKTTNLQGPALDAMGKQFLEMSKRIPVSATELMAFGQSAAQLGVKGTDNILKFSEVMAKLSKSSNVVGEEGSAQLARLINSTRGSMDNVDRLASSIVYLGNNFAVTEAEVLEFGTRLGSATAIFNVSAQDALGMATALKSVGIQAELGSSAVQRGFMGINEAIGKGGAKLQALSHVTGIAAGDLKKAFAEDSVGVFQKFTAGLGRLGKEGKDITKVLEYFGLTGVGNTQVLGTLATKTQLLSDALEGSRKAFAENTALNKEFEQFLGSLDSQIILSKNKFIELAISIGERLKPAILAALDIFTKIAGFLVENPMFTNVALAIAGVTAVIGPMLLAFGTFLTMLPSMIAGWVALKLAVGAFGATAMVALAPIAIIMAKIIAAAALIYGAVKLGSYVGEKIAGAWGNDPDNSVPELAADNPVHAGIAARRKRSGLEATEKVNREFIQRTNNARVDITVRDKNNSAQVVSESENGALTINRGNAGTW